MTRKLTLDVEKLSVASFETGESLAEARGTVKAREVPTWPYPGCPATYHTCASFDVSCIAQDD
ncbi:MAG TPA: hypothetical protein VF746_29955 [Longimicrobium sp.]|jgi:hypothetical protein